MTVQHKPHTVHGAAQVWVDSDAMITGSDNTFSTYPHGVTIADDRGDIVLSLHMTTAARRDLGEFLLATPKTADPEPFVRTPCMVGPNWAEVAAASADAGVLVVT